MTSLAAAPTLDVATFRSWLTDDAELAVVDVRPADEVGYASPLVSAAVPADELLDSIDRFVPRPGVRTVLVDGGDGTAAGLARELGDRGRPQVLALEGGIDAWLAQGEDLPTFATLPNSLTDTIAAERGTPSISATDLHALQESGAEVVLLDTRRPFEFEAGHLPGAVSVPGSELLLRLDELEISPDTQVVTYCAGLARAVLGAQTLIDAGAPFPVAYLDEGTPAWREAGHGLETGAAPAGDPVGESARRSAAERAAVLTAADDFARLDVATATAWLRDADVTTYLIDVRTAEEYDAGHVPGAIWTDGARLIGGSFRTLAVRGARVVLVDDLTGARALSVGHWLQRRGHEIALLLVDPATL